MDALCGNHAVYSEISKWIQESQFACNKCAFVVGNACIGKTYSIKYICRMLDIEISEIDTNNCYDSTAFKDMIYKASTSSLVQNLANMNKGRMLLIDNFDAMYSADKSIKTSLLKIIRGIGGDKTDKAFNHIPIICIISHDVYKKLIDIKKHCDVFELHNPTIAEITLMLKSKKIKLAKIKELIKNTDSNITRIFEILDKSGSYVNDYSYSDPKYDIMYLYNAEKFDRSIIKGIVMPDAWQIPLRFHENLIVELQNRNMTQEKKNEIYATFLKNLCIYDLFMHNTEISVEFFCSMIYPVISVKPKKKGGGTNKFTKILSYLSLQKKSLKSSYNSNFPFYQIGNYHTKMLDRKFICFN